MPSSRRTFLAATLSITAGCTAPFRTDTPDGSGTSTPNTQNDSTPSEVPEYTVWHRKMPHDILGVVALGGGPETPRLFIGSAAENGGRDNHALHALALQNGDETWQIGVENPVQTVPQYIGTDAGPRLVFSTGRQSLHGEAFVTHAFDPNATERVWQFDTEDRRFIYPIATTDAQVFIGRQDDQLAQDGEYVYAINAIDGSEQWRTETGDVARTGSAHRRHTLLVNSHRRVRALDSETGDDRWAVEADSQAYDNRAERIFVQQDGVVQGLDLTDGSELWRREFDFSVSGITSPRQAMDETVFVGDSDGRVIALSPLDGTTRWTLSVDHEGFNPTVERTSERLFVAGAGVHAVDDVSGERAWSFSPDVEGKVTVATGAPSTVFATSQRHVWALDPETGTKRWEFAPGDDLAGVSTAGDLVFVGANGTVYAFDGSESAKE